MQHLAKNLPSTFSWHIYHLICHGAKKEEVKMVESSMLQIVLTDLKLSSQVFPFGLQP
jgi:hypothetical protein